MSTLLRFASPVTVAMRSPTDVQVGLDAAVSLILPDAPADADRAVRAFSTWCTPGGAAAAAPAVDPGWIDQAVDALEAAGLLVASPARTDAVTLLGSGPLGPACAATVTASGIAVCTPSDTHPDACPPGRPVLVVGETVEPDRTLLRGLVEARLPHLVVRCEPERTVVGPFVDPGRSACSRCVDLVRRDHDRRWPYLLTQLCRLRVVPDDGAVAWAAATAAAQLRAWFASGAPDTLGTTLELDHQSWTLGARRWPRHPHCGCGRDAEAQRWASTTASTASP